MNLTRFLLDYQIFPEEIFPIVKNRPLKKVKKGYTYSEYAKLQTCVMANAKIEIFDCINDFSDSVYQQVIFHEVAHIIGTEYGLELSSAWLNLSEWEKDNRTKWKR